MILIVDNYDSFTFNLVQQFKNIDIEVLRNDDPNLLEVATVSDGIVFSPGPGRPEEAGQMIDLIETFKEKKPILGICLGHQAIGQIFGANTKRADKIMHGKQSTLTYQKKGILKNFENELTVMRYHSLIVAQEELANELEVLAEVDGLAMIIQHQTLPIIGLQFHPESLGTPKGQYFIDEFIQLVKSENKEEVA